MISVELLALDFTGFQNIFGQGFEDGFLLKAEAEPFHLSDQAALPVTDIPMELRPSLAVVDVQFPPPMRRLYVAISASAYPFFA